MEAEKVHSGVGKEAHLTCIVHGEPRPSVSFVEVSRFDGINTVPTFILSQDYVEMSQ